MLVNNKNISTFGATLIDRKLTNHEVISINDWLDGAPSPVFLREYTRYKGITLTFLFEGVSEQVIISNIDAMVAAIRHSTLKFDDLDFYYDAHLEGTIETEKINKKAYKVGIEMLAHRTYKAEQIKVVNAALDTNLNNTGTMETPVQIILIPSANLASYTISGLSKKPIVLKNLIKNSTYIIDAYTSRYLRDGANDIANYDGFEFPIAQVGSNNITFSSTNASVTLKHFPKFN